MACEEKVVNAVNAWNPGTGCPALFNHGIEHAQQTAATKQNVAVDYLQIAV
jgi:hypothetical protein